VIATRKAVEGTLLKHWIHYIPAEEPIDFVHRIVELLRIDRKQITKIANERYNYVKFNHSASAVVEMLLDILKDST
jgi:hypothetical protein